MWVLCQVKCGCVAVLDNQDEASVQSTAWIHFREEVKMLALGLEEVGVFAPGSKRF